MPAHSLHWSKPEVIVGNRLCIQSTCGRFAITRPQDRDNEYSLMKLVGVAWRDAGTYENVDAAKAAATALRERARY